MNFKSILDKFKDSKTISATCSPVTTVYRTSGLLSPVKSLPGNDVEETTKKLEKTSKQIDEAIDKAINKAIRTCSRIGSSFLSTGVILYVAKWFAPELPEKIPHIYEFLDYGLYVLDKLYEFVIDILTKLFNFF